MTYQQLKEALEAMSADQLSQEVLYLGLDGWGLFQGYRVSSLNKLIQSGTYVLSPHSYDHFNDAVKLNYSEHLKDLED